LTEHSTSLMRAISGPVLLITVGVLFAFDKFTEFRFTETWPVLLIVLGLLHLAGGGRRGLRDRGNGFRPPSQDSGSRP
jgi:hypothetical protein